MPLKNKTAGRRSGPKVFRCTGFGDCNMVFTRSEHLARHARKHTGEKPFKCIVPGCERRFSRFDNMMQHTHTHDRQRKRGSLSKGSAPSERRHSTSVLQMEARPVPMTRRASTLVQSRVLPPPGPLQYAGPKRAWSSVSLSSSSSSSSPPRPRPPAAFQDNRIPELLPPLDYPPLSPTLHPLSTKSDAQLTSPSFIQDNQRRISISTDSSIDSLHSVPVSETTTKRRLSLADLSTPIHRLQTMSLGNDTRGKPFDPIYTNNASQHEVDITFDEYEALQGFSCLHAKPTAHPPPNDSPHLGSQVHTIRHRLSIQESHTRPYQPQRP